MKKKYDVAIVGAGIVGLAHAWSAARLGRSVALFERHPQARGASVRNFGMVWPIGQPPGAKLELALHSRRRWLELHEQSGIWLSRCGSLHLAYEEDEWSVLNEFASRSGDWGYDCELLASDETVQHCPAVRGEGLRGSLHSTTECCVDPREVIARMPLFLAEQFNVDLFFGKPIIAIDSPSLVTSDGQRFEAEQILVCSGSDFETLFPETFVGAGIRRCKLQMMRTAPQPNGWRIGPHLAGGLTLCHYVAFNECPSLPRLRERFSQTMPDYLRLGIHVMASQNQRGEVVIGDSHEYDDEIELFDKPSIDEMILFYLNRMVQLPDPTVQARWHGIYAKHPSDQMFTAQPQPNVWVRVAPGGTGMTLSFALADQFYSADRIG